jgi:dipeptidyl aminopeptidase/acylaminoacyl peptidase
MEQRLALMDSRSGRVRLLSPPELYVYEYDWSPDGSEIVATAAAGEGDDNWYVAQLYTFDIDSGKAKPIFKPELQITAPRWSPDGKQIGFISGLMSGRTGGNSGDVFLISPDGGSAQNLAPRMDGSANRLSWLSANRMMIREFADGGSRLSEIDLQGKISRLWPEADVSSNDNSVGDISVTPDGTASAMILQAFGRLPEVWAGPIHEWKQITHANTGTSPTPGRVASLHWKSDEWRIQGWLTYPRDYDPKQRYPMIVDVHGGPSGIATANCGQAYASHGFFVLCPNFRGSAGFGEAFQRANVRDLGYGDLRDILAGVNKALEVVPVDRNRIGITGQSYGGYMAMWAPTQTHIFRAAVANAGISDWLSYMGEAAIPQWVRPYFGVSIYDDPAIYGKSAPITYVKNVTTPMLIVVGSGDGECPAAQSQEFWYALKSLGVETQFVIYQDEGHGIRKPEHVRDVTARTVAWFSKYLR